MQNMRPGTTPPGRWAIGRQGKHRLPTGLVCITAALVVLTAGCSLSNEPLPSDVSDPALVQTPRGAQQAYAGTLSLFEREFGGTPKDGAPFLMAGGLLSDELYTERDPDAIDQRASFAFAPGAAGEGEAEPIYKNLQQVRGEANQAIGLLSDYLPDSVGFRSHLYAIKGYSEIFLAELFCSGIPLSTLDYKGDFTYKPGSTTQDVLEHAVALFDTSITLAGDNARFRDLARVGKGRALLGLGQYTAAATAVAAVADSFRYVIAYNNVPSANGGVGPAQNFATVQTVWRVGSMLLTVPDSEGRNGLDWRTSGDPRTAVTTLTDDRGATYYHPAKYATDGSSSIVLASGIEARLIEAETALQQGDVATWLAKLNSLRETAWPTIIPSVTAPLSDTTDPGTDSARISLQFRERAFWLFLTGHRQGDLRRLLRDPKYQQYWRSESSVYPSGFYIGSTSYGDVVSLPVPQSESAANPLYTGCASTGA